MEEVERLLEELEASQPPPEPPPRPTKVARRRRTAFDRLTTHLIG
jgi:hypothetical protein